MLYQNLKPEVTRILRTYPRDAQFAAARALQSLVDKWDRVPGVDPRSRSIRGEEVAAHGWKAFAWVDAYPCGADWRLSVSVAVTPEDVGIYPANGYSRLERYMGRFLDTPARQSIYWRAARLEVAQAVENILDEIAA